MTRNIIYGFIVTACFSLAFTPDAMAVSEAEDDASYDIRNINTNVEVYDPFETVNRGIYGFNQILDKFAIKPAAKAYRFAVPEIGRRGIRNFLRNLTEPVTLLNSAFQGDVKHSFTTFWRFTLNTTIGIGGLNDIAAKAGLEHRKEDYGQTIGVYGVGSGPYLMLPVLGPSNARDTAGLVVDTFTDPFNYAFNDYQIAGRALTSGLDTREANLELIDDIERVSLDTYAAIRSLYSQKRISDIKDRSGGQ